MSGDYIDWASAIGREFRQVEDDIWKIETDIFFNSRHIFTLALFTLATHALFLGFIICLFCRVARLEEHRYLGQRRR
jgi:hypothetical protein